MNSTTNDGEKMEKQMWEDIKASNWEVVESKSLMVFRPFIRMARATAPTKYL
jgi:hypothetical protein